MHDNKICLKTTASMNQIGNIKVESDRCWRIKDERDEIISSSYLIRAAASSLPMLIKVKSTSNPIHVTYSYTHHLKEHAVKSLCVCGRVGLGEKEALSKPV